jgi:serine/threonine-protein kinase PknG
VTACARPGCTGTIEADGYCSDCFFPPGPTPPPGQAGPAGVSTGTGAVARVSVPVPHSRPGSGLTRPSGASRRRLGGGLIELPPVPARDPVTAVLKNPRVEERRRFCSVCEQPVGRGRDGKPGRAGGFCARCRTPFSFTPKLKRGEMVAGQYEVFGCLAYGGQGWIYLAADHSLGMRWVVLKGLLNTGDPAAQAAALAERRFLAEVKHPNIVGVYNFVQHADRRTQATAGYIVMEYVGGHSLRQILLEQREAGRSLPVAHALAYALEVLPALGYLHDRGLVYCDFKPDNAVLAEEHLKLIDMGAVRRIDDDTSDIYGTDGYRAPEISTDGPSPAADLYTVGRSLAVLTFEFAGFTREYAHSLPDPATVRVLAEQESFCRLLRRATDPDPRRRFTSAQEMTQQLTGVLREVLSVEDGVERPSFSTLFSPELQAIGVAAAAAADGTDGTGPLGVTVTSADIVAGLPVPLPDSADPAAGYLATLSALDPPGQAGELAAVAAGRPGTPPGVADSVEVRLALARARILAGEPDAAAADLAGLVEAGRADWRVTWYQGLGDLAAGRPGPARAAFEAVYDTLPG